MKTWKIIAMCGVIALLIIIGGCADEKNEEETLPTVSISVNSNPVAWNTTAILTIVSSNVTGSCSLSDEVGVVPVSVPINDTFSVTTDPLTTETTFTAECDDVSNSVTVSVNPMPMPTASISAVPLSIEWNGSSTVSWTSENVLSCSVTDSAGAEVSTDTAGSFNLSGLTVSVSHAITCTGPDGIATASDSVTIVVGPDLTPLVTLTANPSSVAYNTSSTLSWSSANTALCSLKDEGGSEVATGVSGAYTTSALTANVTYSVSCTGSNGDVSDSVTIVVGAPLAPTANITAEPLSVAYSGSTTVSWSSTNTTSCSVTDGDAVEVSTALSGSLLVESLITSATYSISCTGLDGVTAASDSVMIVVGPDLTPSVVLTADASSIPYNGNVTLSWQTANATGCVITGNYGSWNADGYGPWNTDGTYTFSELREPEIAFAITCASTTSEEMVSDTVPVTVIQNDIEVRMGLARRIQTIERVWPIFFVRFLPADSNANIDGFFADMAEARVIPPESGFPGWGSSGLNVINAMSDIECKCALLSFDINGADPERYLGEWRLTIRLRRFGWQYVEKVLVFSNISLPPVISNFSIAGVVDESTGDRSLMIEWADPQPNPYITYTGELFSSGSPSFLGDWASSTSPLVAPVIWESGIPYTLQFYATNWDWKPESSIPSYPLLYTHTEQFFVR